MEVWIYDEIENKFRHFKTFSICATSGTLGPKRKEGDLQIPEGFYEIDRFNPVSNFHLSLGINYPNQADKKFTDAKNPGGDIFIHGSCVTVGCLPMTEEVIKEIYILAVTAKSNGQERIPVHIFPFRLSDKRIQQLSSEFENANELSMFWTDLKVGYDHFNKNKNLPE